MTQINELNNHYTVNNVEGWPALFKRLQESSGQPIVDIAHAYCYDVGGVGNPEHFYDIRIQSSSVDNHATTYLIVTLGGKPLVNDPMHNLRSAEELVETMISLRKSNLENIAIQAVSEITNFFLIEDEDKHHKLVEQLIAAGADHNEHQTSFGFSLMGHGSRYNLDVITRHGKLGMTILLDGKGVLNVGVPKLHNAEDMLEQILLAHKTAVFNSEKDGLVPLGYNNFYASAGPDAWKEAVEALGEFGDIVNGNPTTVVTGPEGVSAGTYVIQVVTHDAKFGVEVLLDGVPLFNYPKPMLRTAEQIINVIMTLRAKFHKGSIGTEFNFNLDDERKPLVASVKTSSGTLVQLFANGVITIQHPTLLTITTPNAQKMVELLANGVEESLTEATRVEEE